MTNIEWLTTTETANLLGLSGETVRRLVDAGRLEGVVYDHGGRRTIRIARSAVETYAREGRQRAQLPSAWDA